MVGIGIGFMIVEQILPDAEEKQQAGKADEESRTGFKVLFMDCCVHVIGLFPLSSPLIFKIIFKISISKCGFYLSVPCSAIMRCYSRSFPNGLVTRINAGVMR